MSRHFFMCNFLIYSLVLYVVQNASSYYLLSFIIISSMEKVFDGHIFALCGQLGFVEKRNLVQAITNAGGVVSFHINDKVCFVIIY